MFFYYTFALLTAPGVMVHELGHALFCVLSGIKIHKIKLFRFGNPAGYVVHDEPNNFIASLLVTFGPLVVNSLTALLLFARTTLEHFTWQTVLLAWLGAAIGLHAIPSDGDAKTLLSTTNRRIWRNPFVVIGYPFVLLLSILNLFKRLHIDFIYMLVLLWLGAWFLKG